MYRIEVYSKIEDARARVRLRKLGSGQLKGKIKNTHLADVYSLDHHFTSLQLEKIAHALSNPVFQGITILSESKKTRPYTPGKFAYAVEIGFLPGVTDNVASTAKEIIEDLFNIKFPKGEGVYTSQVTFVDGDISRKEAEEIALSLHNPLIQRAQIKSYKEYMKDRGMDIIIPKVKLTRKPQILEVDLDITDEKLQKIGKQGILGTDGKRRGPLALDLLFMKTIQKYFKKLGRNPTDIELESLAQTWSEHCKHTIFADPIDDIKDGLFRTYIKRATDKIRKAKGKKDKCVSVFHDNSGAVEFDDHYLITHKIETHNSPSALDPFGGSITGIVGVNRDTIGFGLGARPVANFYGFCFADPGIDCALYKGPDFTQKMLSSRKIMDGVIEGVNAGGNQSGIPTPSGFLYFDERYRGKPLVFVGTLGIIPKKIKGKPSHIKKARPGDLIVVIGGRVGKDGIHGATFSSEAMDTGSPVTAVQIGDPITQKKLSDAVVKEARDMLLYNSITDNGAGGLSCSVAEMAKESGGCQVDLEKVPLKYPGLDPWEIWVSESQERMTLSIPRRNLRKFLLLMKKRGVEATVIGKFDNSGKCVVRYFGKKIMDIGLSFLHYGLPRRPMKTESRITRRQEPGISTKKDLTADLMDVLARPNIAGFEFISSQYDYIVQSNNVLPPLHGPGRINSQVTAIKPVLSSNRGAILSYGIYPGYSDIDTYLMAACALDTAVRNVISAGGNIEEIYLLDNFCWCEGNDPFRLRQLKLAARACYEYAKVYKTPFISGKDSMFNDFKGYDEKGNQVKISIPPTLLISSIGIVSDVTKLISMDVKSPGDLIYLLGDTCDELGASEYFLMLSEKQKGDFIGNNVPKVNADKNLKIYRRYQEAADSGFIASAISVGRGGLAIALAKSAMAGKLGLEIKLKGIPGDSGSDIAGLFSESQGRILVTVSPEKSVMFEKLFKELNIGKIGKVRQDRRFIARGNSGNKVIDTEIQDLLTSYRSTFKSY